MSAAVEEHISLMRDWALTPAEARLILSLLDHPSHFLCREEVQRIVSIHPEYTSGNSDAVTVSRLRKKLIERGVEIARANAGFGIGKGVAQILSAIGRPPTDSSPIGAA